MPSLSVFPEEVGAGGAVTISWQGLLMCEGEPAIEGGLAQVSLAEWNGTPIPEPYTPPTVVAANWAQIPLIGQTPLGSVVAVVPGDLPPGQYYVFVNGVDLIMSPPFTVNG